MIGNDIIDLESAKKESNWRRKGFLEKLFTNDEQELITSSLTPDVMIWNLWSMKEAVYKADFRRTLNYEYAPLKIRCISLKEDCDGLQGELLYNEIRYFTITRVLSNCLHTIACRWKHDFSNLRIIEVADYPEKYLIYLKQKHLISHNELIVKGNHGIPNLLDFQREKIYPISISHHGRFLATVSLPYYSF